MTFTKERLEQLIRAIDSESYDEEEIVGWVNSDEIWELARMALAAQEAEPVGEVVLGEYDDSGCHQDARVVCIAADGQADWENFKDGTRLYAAPPAPVSVPISFEEWSRKCDLQIQLCDPHFREKAQYIWNPCRAAMLQGAEPVSMDYTLPLDYLQGQKDGLEWAARMAEANHPETGDWLYDDPLELAKAIRKGTDMPVEPVQEWIPCSERMPERDYVLAADFSGAYYLPSLPNTQVGIYADWFEDGKPSWDDGDGNDLHLKQVTHWMPLPAAPQQEANNG